MAGTWSGEANYGRECPLALPFWYPYDRETLDCSFSAVSRQLFACKYSFFNQSTTASVGPVQKRKPQFPRATSAVRLTWCTPKQDNWITHKKSHRWEQYNKHQKHFDISKFYKLSHRPELKKTNKLKIVRNTQNISRSGAISPGPLEKRLKRETPDTRAVSHRCVLQHENTSKNNPQEHWTQICLNISRKLFRTFPWTKSDTKRLEISDSRVSTGNFPGSGREISGHFQEMSRTCPGHFQEISGKSPGHFREISWTLLM